MLGARRQIYHAVTTGFAVSRINARQEYAGSSLFVSNNAPTTIIPVLVVAIGGAAAVALLAVVSSEADSRDKKGVVAADKDRSNERAPSPLFRRVPSSNTKMIAFCESPSLGRVLQHSSDAENATLDPSSSSSSPPVPSRGRRLLYYLRLADLPTPRRLIPSDPIFDYPAMKAAIRQRSRDEARLRSLQKDAIEARQSGDVERINDVFQRMSSIAYGSGVPQEREDFLVRHGCTAWTDDILTYLVGLASERGYIEIGAGNGQWARAIEDRQKELATSNGNIAKTKAFDFIIPYDDMTDLPLSPRVYHRHTQAFHDYFHPNVRKCNSHIEAIRKWESRGRVLLLVFPPPGPLALESVKAYVDIFPAGDAIYNPNPTVIYVGEGRGGANANDEFFNYLCGGDWALEKIMDDKPSPGGKGYERMFVLRRLKHHKEQHPSSRE